MSSSLTNRRTHSTQPDVKGKGKEVEKSDQHEHDHDHDHDHAAHDHSHDHGHSHSHSVFSLSHSHSHGEDGPGHTPDAEKIVETLKGGGDRGSRITVIGLLSNVVLTAAKGGAGWYMNSASLLADAGHSMSDLLGDFVTLFCWKLSRRPPSERYPYGFGKFEVMGTTTISILLTAGAVGIGMHSWSLLADSLSQIATTLPAGPIHDAIETVTSVAQSVPTILTEHSHAHAHSHSHALDPNAAWFAAISVIAKEWLYRVTKKVADEERSPVLLANAVHHRSDAYSSLVAFVAILGSWWFPHLPLDPIGGLLVSVLIFQQGWAIMMSAFRQLTDAGVSPRTKSSLLQSLDPLLPDKSTPHIPTPSQRDLHTDQLLGIRDLRAMRAGALMVVDLVADVPRTLPVEHASEIEKRIAETLRKARKEVSEVRIRFNPV
ncbi:cation efflux family-domain-containing protein [Cristinia sonorae]|uniref:Cation efflux family-domain-containing protein n=1 Tax=Cristinia sonorae TaxID=1940300 RepID=A0A8K0UEG0_9AGAR|nr:cation efflux family-domain-containing protein [Cristinia sonorae]